jgi:hypothetical protein
VLLLSVAATFSTLQKAFSLFKPLFFSKLSLIYVHYYSDRPTVQLFGCPTVQLFDCSTVRLFDYLTVGPSDRATVRPRNHSTSVCDGKEKDSPRNS